MLLTMIGAHSIRWLKCWLPVVLMPILLISVSIEVALRWDPWSTHLFANYNIYETVPDADQIHKGIMAYYFRQQPSLDPALFKQVELDHFADVRALLTLNWWLMWTFLSGYIMLLWRSEHRGFILQRGGMLVWAVAIGLGLLASRWSLFFMGSHPILFADSWEFHRDRHIMVRIYPEDYLASQGLWIMILIMVLSALAVLAGRLCGQRLTTSGWYWQKGFSYVSIATLVLAPVAYFAGLHMVEPDTWAWNSFYVVACCCLFGCVAPVFSWDRMRAIVFPCCGVFLYMSFAQGARTHALQAEAYMREDGERIIAAIDSYWRDHRRLPRRLADLCPVYLPSVPQIDLSHHTFWDYNPRRTKGSRNYYLEFDGPLSYAYSYSSHNDRWKYLKAP